MLMSAIVRIVALCARWPWHIVLSGAVLAIAAAAFDVTHFSITTDTENLISRSLPWRQRQADFSRLFPEKQILVVVTASTAENAERATSMLADDLSKHGQYFQSVSQPEGGDLFKRNGLLFESLNEVKRATEGLSKADFLIETLASDPSLRGTLSALAFATEGIKEGKITLDQLAWPLTLTTTTLSDVFAGKPATFSWQTLVQGQALTKAALRRFIEVQPVLNFSALQPGLSATEQIHRSATDLRLSALFDATVRLTGTVPLNDDQFSVIGKSALRDTLTALVGTLAVLWLALRSWKIIAAVSFSVVVGLAVTTALGLAMVGAFNLLSIAFFVLFVGLGVDFGIQFSVRYRSERYLCGDLHEALIRAAREIAAPLSLAAAATALAFFSFLPTNYEGLSELGLIAGCGMLVAFLCSITLVPAMLTLLSPPGEAAEIGFVWLAPLDDLLHRHRIGVIIGTFLVVFAATPLLLNLSFDLDPIDLQDPHAPSVMTFRELQDNAMTSGTDADVVVGSLADAETLAKQLSTLPEVSATRTLNSFVPDEQPEKLAAIGAAAKSLRPALASKTLPPPTDLDDVNALRSTAASLTAVAGQTKGNGADAARTVAGLLIRLASADASIRSKATLAFVPPLTYDLARLRDGLSPQAINIHNLPQSIVTDWLLPDGRARVQAQPKGRFSTAGVLETFANAVLAIAPASTGPAISLYESGRTVIRAFVEAGCVALGVITVLLLVVLRRPTHVMLTLVPLLLAGLVTLEVCGLIGIKINFANIIALPLLLGVGVAFKIYYILAWRNGATHLLETSLTRAIIFSALTNAAAFGSMWSSAYPGISSMGKMMALALLCTMAAAVLFQPVLMGEPRRTKTHSEADAKHLTEAAE